MFNHLCITEMRYGTIVYGGWTDIPGLPGSAKGHDTVSDNSVITIVDVPVKELSDQFVEILFSDVIMARIVSSQEGNTAMERFLVVFRHTSFCQLSGLSSTFPIIDLVAITFLGSGRGPLPTSSEFFTKNLVNVHLGEILIYCDGEAVLCGILSCVPFSVSIGGAVHGRICITKSHGYN